MKKILLPLGLLVLGLGGGVGAGLALAPPKEEPAEACAAPEAAGHDEGTAGHAEAEPAHGEEAGEHGAAADPGEAAEGHAEAEPVPAEAPCEAPADDVHAEEAAADHGGGGHGEAGGIGHDYVKLPNQFVVPVVEDGEVVALVLLSLSVEVPAGGEDGVTAIEPKLRDAFLRVLFDHANTGGFEGMFTASGAMRPLRAALLAAAGEASEGLVTDVLIVEMVRQDR